MFALVGCERHGIKVICMRPDAVHVDAGKGWGYQDKV